jgi:hypothetical protein
MHEEYGLVPSGRLLVEEIYPVASQLLHCLHTPSSPPLAGTLDLQRRMLGPMRFMAVRKS